MVVIDSRLTMSDHVAAVCRAGYYRLRQLRPTVLSTLQGHWFRRLFQTAWITATLLSVASLTPCLGSCSRFRIRRPGYSYELANENTLHQSWDSSTGYLSSVESTLSWQWLMYQISHVLARQVQVGQWSEQRQTTFVVPRTKTKLGDRRFAAAKTGPQSIRDTYNLQKTKTFLFSD